jgi:SAM-dependent methyltransferase
MSTIRADFDRLAQYDTDEWDHNLEYQNNLPRQLPVHLGQSLEIGCGTGQFARLLAQRSDRVLALDLSPEMIRIANERSAGYPNIDFQVADVLTWDFPREQFDCIASIATLHHMPLEPMLIKMKQALKLNGMLMILDLLQGENRLDYLSSAIAFPLDALMRLVHNRHLRSSPEVRAAWDSHGKSDVYLTFSAVRRVCDKVLPGAQMRKHLFWRYSVTWTKKD